MLGFWDRACNAFADFLPRSPACFLCRDSVPGSRWEPPQFTGRLVLMEEKLSSLDRASMIDIPQYFFRRCCQLPPNVIAADLP